MLSWTSLNPTVNFFPVKKLFYNRYFNKIKIYCPGSRVLDAKTIHAMRNLLRNRLEIDFKVNYNFGGSWWNVKSIEELKVNCRVDQLNYFYEVKQKNTEILFRLEEPYITLYSNTEHDLFTIAKENYPERLLEVHRPKNDQEKLIIDKGEIVAKPNEQYNYKIVLRPIKFDSKEQKHSILDYLYNLDDQIKISKTLIFQLQSPRLWFPGGYLFTKDDTILIFINLICPDLIGSIFKLTKTQS